MKVTLPPASALAKHALIAIGGAILAAFIVGKVPRVRDWIKAQWGDSPTP